MPSITTTCQAKTTLSYSILFTAIISCWLQIAFAGAETWDGSDTTTGNAYRLGHVGIGISNPAAELHVVDSTNYVEIRATTTVASKWAFLEMESDCGIAEIWKAGSSASGYAGARAMVLYNSEDYPIAFFQGSNERMRINSGGNIGIGTTSPGSYKLKVVGTAVSDTLAGDKIRVGIDPYSMYITQNTQVYGGSSYSCDIGHFVNIANNPNNAVNVDGAIHATTVIVTDSVVADKICISNWTIEAPDYVFDRNYDLPKLVKVESFIHQNKHLPDVPSAKQMKKDGVDLAEMNMTLLKKVEELTLYMIEQDKRIKELENKISAKN